MNYIYAALGGMVVGGGTVYWFYAKLKASIGAVEVTAKTMASQASTVVKDIKGL